MVGGIVEQVELNDTLQERLDGISDLERLASKIATKRINPRELNTLKSSLKSLSPIIEVLETSDNKELKLQIIISIS